MADPGSPVADASPTTPSSPPTATLLGCRIHLVTMEEAVGIARGFLKDGTPHHIVTADASMLVMATEDPALRSLVNTADLTIPDSMGVVWGTSRVKMPAPERVPGVDLMERLCKLGGELGLTAYFLGAAPGVADEAARKLEAKYPGFRVTGSHHGFLQPGDEAKLEAEIVSLKPDLLFVAMGIPKQEKWIRERMARLGVPISVGVGGSFDCHSGRVQRAPKLFQRLNIEWLYRLATNPTKLKKVALLPRFAWMVLRKGSKG